MIKTTNLNKSVLFLGLAFLSMLVPVVLVMLVLNTAADILTPIIHSIKSILSKENIHNISFISPPVLILKLAILCSSLYLIFVAYSVASAIFTYSSYEIAARNFAYKKQDLTNVIFKAISWNLYRIRYILRPPAVILLVALMLVIFSILLFNSILTLAGISIGIITFTSSFTALGILFCFIFSMVISVQRAFTTVFGFDCAVSEPDLPNNTIKERSERLAFILPFNFNIHLLNLLSIFVISAQFFGAILFPGFINQENFPLIIMIIILDIVFLLGLGYLRTSLYLDSLLHKHKKIMLKTKLYSTYT